MFLSSSHAFAAKYNIAHEERQFPTFRKGMGLPARQGGV